MFNVSGCASPIGDMSWLVGGGVETGGPGANRSLPSSRCRTRSQLRRDGSRAHWRATRTVHAWPAWLPGPGRSPTVHRRLGTGVERSLPPSASGWPDTDLGPAVGALAEAPVGLEPPDPSLGFYIRGVWRTHRHRRGRWRRWLSLILSRDYVRRFCLCLL